MDDQWLANVKQTTLLLVPTRTLANHLNERVAYYFTLQGQTVWVAPNILVWSDYARQMWQLNRDKFATRSLISPSQAALLWTQVIESTRRQENDLALLNVQQTTRAVQNSWKLMHEWGIQAAQLQLDHVADTEQFIAFMTRI